MEYLDHLYKREINREYFSYVYLSSIYNKIHQNNFNYLGMFVGKHRVGKSLSAVTFASILDKTFERYFEERVVYYPEEFMFALKRIAKLNIVGGAVIWDEAGVGLPAREWYDISNKAINYAIQVFGYLKPIVFFVSQDISYIDKQPRKLFHAFYEVYRPGSTHSTIKCFNIEYDKKRERTPYFIYPRVHIKHGPSFILKKIKLYMPPKELIERYENHSKPFKDKIMKQMSDRTKKFEAGEIKKRDYTVSEIVEEVLRNYPYYESKSSKKDNPILDATAIKYEFKIPGEMAKFIKNRCEKLIIQERAKGRLK